MAPQSSAGAPAIPPTTPAPISAPALTPSDPLSAPAPVPDSTAPPSDAPADPNSPSHPLEVPPKDAAADASPTEPMCHVRALIISGENHVFSFEPELTVGRMKELIWSGWPSQWTEPAQPPSPSFLRILYGGRILSDESTLASNNLPAAVAPTIPTVIHVSVRSFSLRPEDDPQKGSLLHPVGSRNRNARGDDVGGCKCIIM